MNCLICSPMLVYEALNGLVQPDPPPSTGESHIFRNKLQMRRKQRLLFNLSKGYRKDVVKKSRAITTLTKLSVSRSPQQDSCSWCALSSLLRKNIKQRSGENRFQKNRANDGDALYEQVTFSYLRSVPLRKMRMEGYPCM